MARTVAIVPHTHWDREWYQPFQVFRLRLVSLLDRLLPQLESDPSYARFLLDGQMAVVDDYLELRPHAEERLRRLAATGRVSMGPWYVLMDEFCVSGETIVRDLQLGIERAAAFGGAMPVGYLPDMFGHVGQMPQILRQAGFEHTVVWRGVPAAVNRTGFWWSAPDGSTVRAEYLPVGYGNGASMPDDAKALLRRIEAHERELGDLLPDDGGLLWMNGTDHQTPQPWVGRVVAEANELQSDYDIAVTSLPEYLAAAPTEGLPSWTGELRSGARANLLMGVASNRVDVKQAAARAERSLERRAEPLSALFLPEDKWPDAELRLAWREVIRNSAHDSSCACSDDEVVAAVLHRYAEARQVGDGLARRALRALSTSMAESGAVVVNPSARTRSGTVELVVPAVGPVEGAQVVRVREASSTVYDITGGDVNMVLGRIRNDEIVDGADIVAVHAEEVDGVYEVSLTTGVTRHQPGVGAASSELYAQAGARRSSPVRLRVEREAFQVVLARATGVPGFGWQRWEPSALESPVRAEGSTVLDNGMVRLEVDPANGTFSVNGLAGLDRLVDDGDEGDTYNYSPPAEDVVVDTPVSVDVEVLEGGPVRGRLRVTRQFVWPSHIEDHGRAGERAVEITTDLELHAGEDVVRIETRLDNVCRDHRLRTWFPLPSQASVSRAECAFTVVERGLTAEGGPHEYGLPTFPSRRFVSAGGLTLVHEGLLEYEVVDDGTALALTLLRCTGMLSGTDMTYRPWPAGPPYPAEGAQMRGPQVLRYAVHVGERDPYAVVDEVFLPLEVAVAPGSGDRADNGTALHVEGAEVSAVLRRAGALEVRVFNPTDTETTVVIDGRRGWLVDLRGRPLEPFDGSFPLGPQRIATALLAD